MQTIKKGQTMILDGRHIVRVARGGAKTVEVTYEHGPRYGDRVKVSTAQLTPSRRPAKDEEIVVGAELWAPATNGRIKVEIVEVSAHGIKAREALRGQIVNVSRNMLMVDEASRIRAEG